MFRLERPNARDWTRWYFAIVMLCAITALAGCKQPAADPIEDYQTFLSISQVKSYYYTEPGTLEKYPLVQGSLANLGSRSLIVVEFTLRFKDTLQRVICEEQFYPVFVSEFAQPEANQSLGPGQKTRFAFKAPKCPPTWQPGGVDIKISKVVFAKTT